MQKTPELKLQEVLTRQVAEILPSKKALETLMKKKKIRVYFGVDPTAPYLHLGHTIPLRKLKQFQELGHQTILLFGTFTAQIGDPSGREQQRQPLSFLQVKKNMATYKKQAGKILDFSKTKIQYNSDWLSKLTLERFLKLTSHFTVAQLLERDMFERRMQKGQEIWVNEFLYPLMQGYDSVVMNVDLEIGATDQTFNMLIGRRLQKIYNNKEKFILTVPLLPGLDGRKMSKTYGNTVNILDPPKEMYRKLMTLKDELISQYFELCTDVPLNTIQNMARTLSKKDFKSALARAVVEIYHGTKAAINAEKEFNRIFVFKKPPQRIPQLPIFSKEIPLVDLLVKTKLAPSKSQARRLIGQKGVKIDGVLQEDWKKVISVQKGMIIQVGRQKFVQLA